MKKIKILRNIIVSVGALFALAGLLAAGMNDDAMNFSKSPPGLSQPPIISFDPPGAGTGPLQGTEALAINQAEKIVGSFSTPSFVFRGFIRYTDNTFTEFDAPGAGTGQFQGTDVEAIDDAAGAITGFVRDSSDVLHGFLRAANGTFAQPFDAPGAGTGVLQGTLPGNINATGLITGSYIDSANVNHGFVRDVNGIITSFDAPNAGTGPGQGTLVNSVDCLTDAGITVGDYIDASNAYHGFVRALDGTISEFDWPGAGTGPGQGSLPTGINQAGTIEGWDIDSNSVTHGVVGGTVFDVPGAGTSPGQGTFPANINASGAVTGWYIDSSGVNHSFLRTPDGTITTFDAPGAGTGSGQGTQASCNNPSDAITGFYLDSNNALHGFLRSAPLRPQPTPRPRPTPAPRP